MKDIFPIWLLYRQRYGGIEETNICDLSVTIYHMILAILPSDISLFRRLVEFESRKPHVLLKKTIDKGVAVHHLGAFGSEAPIELKYKFIYV